ncbi:MAG: DUF2892 domain-containing protein [Deltaproteobacteria bacterium]|nr:DUF2892 domain-containing protein [Deltaproteobacteria bacterium]
MKQNVCSRAEQIIRVIIGVALLSLLFTLEGAARYWGLVGLVPIATVVFKYCPLSHLFGMDTCRMKQVPAKPG